MDIKMIPKEFGGDGIWEVKPGNVPKDFPLQMDDLSDDDGITKTESKEIEKDEDENDDDSDKEQVKKKDDNLEIDENVIMHQQAVCGNEPNDLTEEANI